MQAPPHKLLRNCCIDTAENPLCKERNCKGTSLSSVSLAVFLQRVTALIKKQIFLENFSAYMYISLKLNQNLRETLAKLSYFKIPRYLSFFPILSSMQTSRIFISSHIVNFFCHYARGEIMKSIMTDGRMKTDTSIFLIKVIPRNKRGERNIGTVKFEDNYELNGYRFLLFLPSTVLPLSKSIYFEPEAREFRRLFPTLSSK